MKIRDRKKGGKGCQYGGGHLDGVTVCGRTVREIIDGIPLCGQCIYWKNYREGRIFRKCESCQGEGKILVKNFWSMD